MEAIYLISGIVAGAIISSLGMYLFFNANRISRHLYDDLQKKVLTLEADNRALTEKQHEIKSANDKLWLLQSGLQQDKETLIGQKAKLEAFNKSLQDMLEHQKSEVTQLQQQAKEQFENLANRILEEKSSKFTVANQENLKRILEPFQEKITDLKKRVNEAYDIENKERFSLAEKVKELAALNQQISADAQKLARALKGESKTQGNWGEMILASILEKSGLEKGREYFLEHQLTDENNQAIFSAFSGKKMRPDAVVKYPDNRTVIIDAKVSLTAFVEMNDESDPINHQIKQQQHVESVKRHIEQLSSKAYDDYKQSLDFVMMFVPNEAAYMAAMQGDPELWNYAYTKRVVLLNPGNLITSLKLIADMWKRDKQTKNVLDIAERGGRLYDKFASFVEDMERIQKSIDDTQKAYAAAYNKLWNGRGNIVSQAQALKTLGVKTKKELSLHLVEKAITSGAEE